MEIETDTIFVSEDEISDKMEVESEKILPSKDKNLVESSFGGNEINFLAEEDVTKGPETRIIWREISEDVKPKKFELRNPCLLLERPKDMSVTSPIEIFKIFFDDDFWNILEKQTNLYAAQLKEDNKAYLEAHPQSRIIRRGSVSQQQLKKWFAARLLMPIHSNSQIHSNWSKDPLLSTNFKTIMSEEEFWKVSALFHLSNDKDENAATDKLHHISAFHRDMQEKWNNAYHLPHNLTLDEGMIPYSGKLSFLQFMKGKPTRLGIKVFMVASSTTGYVYKMRVYTGRENEQISTQQLVEDMVEGMEHSAHILYIDNFYTSIKLLKSLRSKDIRCTGTIRKNRIHDKELVADFHKTPNGTVKAYTNEGDFDLTLLLWKDRNDVYMISNHRDGSIEEVENKKTKRKRWVPCMRTHYNEKTRGVDKANQLCATFRYNHTQKHWWMAIYEEIIQITLSNIFIIYQYFNHKPMTRKDVHLEIIRYLTQGNQIEKPFRLYHYLDWVPLKKNAILARQRRVAFTGLDDDTYIKKDFRLKCKNKCGKKTDLYCKHCSTSTFTCSLCVPDCFVEYHRHLI